jgi:hypothetical protein
LAQSDLSIGQIAGGVFCPYISINCLSPHPQVAVTQVEVLAPGTATLEQAFSVLKPFHYLVRGVHPDFAELSLAYIAK